MRWILIIRFTITFLIFFNQTIINCFGMYNILQNLTHILNIIILSEIFFPSLLSFKIRFYFSSGVGKFKKKLLVFLILLVMIFHKKNIPKAIIFFIRILLNNISLNNDSILFTEIIILYMIQYRHISPKHIMN